jgi:hypothetical protein
MIWQSNMSLIAARIAHALVISITLRAKVVYPMIAQEPTARLSPAMSLRKQRTAAIVINFPVRSLKTHSKVGVLRIKPRQSRTWKNWK